MQAEWFIIRHGETDYNNRQLIQGNIEIPLNENGRRQAREAREALLAKGIRFDHVLSSPLDRAQETAEILSSRPRSEFIILPDLVEMAFGVDEGTPYLEPGSRALVFNRNPEKYVPAEGGESIPQVFSRMARCVEGIASGELTGGFLEGNVLISTHGMALRGMLEYVRHFGAAGLWQQMVSNLDMFRFHVEDGVVTEEPMVLSHTDPFDPHFKNGK